MSTDIATLMDKLSSQPILDESILREITEAAGMTPMELVEMFLDDTTMNLDAMHSALTAGDRESLNRAAHTMKSSAGNVGAQRFALIAKTLESATKAAIDSDAPGLLAALVASFTDFTAHVEANRASLSV